jgi:hypothetical protein
MSPRSRQPLRDEDSAPAPPARWHGRVGRVRSARRPAFPMWHRRPGGGSGGCPYRSGRPPSRPSPIPANHPVGRFGRWGGRVARPPRKTARTPHPPRGTGRRLPQHSDSPGGRVIPRPPQNVGHPLLRRRPPQPAPPPRRSKRRAPNDRTCLVVGGNWRILARWLGKRHAGTCVRGAGRNARPLGRSMPITGYSL